EAGVGPQHDLYLRPAGPQLGHDAADFLQRPFGRILVGRTQPGAQQLVAREDVQRQITVAVVVAVEEPLRLVAVKRYVGGVQIEHDPLRLRNLRLDIHVGQQPVDGLGRVADLVIASAASAQFQTVQRALAGQRLAQVPLAAQYTEYRIRAQLLVIVEVFITQRQTVYALRQHLLKPMLDAIRHAAIAEAGRYTPHKADLTVGLAQQQRPAVGGDSARRKPRFHTA